MTSINLILLSLGHTLRSELHTNLAEKVKGFEDRGWIQECTGKTEWVSRAFLMPKPNGKWHPVIDYR